ncbi:transposase [Duncaniella freteri]|uniref:transposase n=1 Tax=Duncaniella freteri TaxID=2530391 RepID=UPI00272F2968|nr:transposase [uncultured Duncaniella sp.]
MGKGRSKRLIEARDEALFRRYHYWTEVKRLRFDDTIRLLSETEFFISEQRVMTIIRRMVAQIRDMSPEPIPKKKQPQVTKRILKFLDKRD